MTRITRITLLGLALDVAVYTFAGLVAAGALYDWEWARLLCVGLLALAAWSGAAVRTLEKGVAALEHLLQTADVARR